MWPLNEHIGTFRNIPNALIFCFIVLLYFSTNCKCLVIHPSHLMGLPSTSFEYVCNGSSKGKINWFKQKEDTEIKILNGDNVRYSIKKKDESSTLIIKASTTEDSGAFVCKTETEISNLAVLEVIVPSATWYPSCRHYPDTLTSGIDVKITCLSSITLLSKDKLPNLAWTKDGSTINGIPFRNTTYSSVTYTRTVNRDDHGKQYVCKASLNKLQNPPSCSLTLYVDLGRGDIVPYIIVVVLGIIAISLFIIVIIFIFRFRDCKYCKETVSQPQQVLDMSAIQTGDVPRTIRPTSLRLSDDKLNDLKKKEKKVTAKIKTNESMTEQKLEDLGLEFENNLQTLGSKDCETKTKDIHLDIMESSEMFRLQEGSSKEILNKLRANNSRAAFFSVQDNDKQLSTPRLKKARCKKHSNQSINNLDIPGSASNRFALNSDSSIKSKPGDEIVYADLNFTRHQGFNITKEEGS